MELKVARHLGRLIAQYADRGKAGFTVRRIAESKPLVSFHPWADDHPLVSADLVRRDDGTALYILLIDWKMDGEHEWYCIIYPESRSGSTAEIWRTEQSGKGESLVWTYLPKKHDGRNEERKAHFERYVGDTTIWVAIPASIRGVPRFLRDLFDLADIRQRADDLDEDELERREEFPEGALVERLHRDRERNSALIKQVKRAALKREGKLVCQVCEFDFAKRYGALGHGFIEAHHTTPLGELTAETVTRPEDIALVCANCHRMLHLRRPWLGIDKLKRVLVLK